MGNEWVVTFHQMAKFVVKMKLVTDISERNYGEILRVLLFMLRLRYHAYVSCHQMAKVIVEMERVTDTYERNNGES